MDVDRRREASTMNAKRKITVSMQLTFIDMAMDSTSAAREIVESVLATMEDKCKDEIRSALEESGATHVSIGEMRAY